MKASVVVGTHTLLAVDDGAFYRLMSVNDGTAALGLTLDLSAWSLPPGAGVTAEEVSQVRGLLRLL